MKYISNLPEGNIPSYAVIDKVREIINVVNAPSQDTVHKSEIDRDLLKDIIKEVLDEIIQEENNGKESDKKEKEKSGKKRGRPVRGNKG